VTSSSSSISSSAAAAAAVVVVVPYDLWGSRDCHNTCVELLRSLADLFSE